MSRTETNHLNVSKLEQALKGAAARAQRLNVAALGTFLIGGALLALFGFFLCDYLTHFPAAVRVLVTAGIAVSFIAVLPRRFRHLWFGRADVFELGRRVEAYASHVRTRGFHSILISALEFARKKGQGGSAELKQSVVSRAHEGDYDPSSIRLHDAALLKRGLRLSAVAAVVYVLWGVVGPHSMMTFAKRMFGLPSEYLTDTRIVAVDYPRVSPQYEPIGISVRAEGELPLGGQVTLTFAGESPFEIKLEGTGVEGEYAATIENPAKDLQFEVSLGDDRSDLLSIRVPRPPFVESGSVVVTAPEYIGQEPREYPLTNFNVYENSRFDIRVTPDRPVSVCELDFGEEQYPLKAQDDGSYALEKILLKSPKRYSIRLVDADGIENSDRVFYFISVTRDRLPVVHLDRPLNDSYWAPVSRLRWTVRASDDYGLRDAKIIYQVAEPTESGKEHVLSTKEIPLPQLENKREATASGEIRLVDLGVQPSQILIVTAMAGDNCVFREKQEWGKSERHRVHIVSAEALRRIIEEEQQFITKMVDDLAVDVERQIRVLKMREDLMEEKKTE